MGNWSTKRDIIFGIIVFQLLIFFALGWIGYVAGENEDFARNLDVPYIYTNETGQIDWDFYYEDLYKKMGEAGFYEFRFGEYGIDETLFEANRIKIQDVYVDIMKHDISDKWCLVPDKGFFGTLTAWQQALEKFLHGDKMKWEHDNLYNVSQGEDVYIYPKFIYNPKGWDWDRWIVIRIWYVNADQWVNDVWKEDVISGGKINMYARLYMGKMPKNDVYYELNFIQADRDIEDWWNFEGYVKMGQAEIVEKYGGFIKGDVSTPNFVGSTMSPHELHLNPATGGVNKIFSLLGNIGKGMNVLTSGNLPYGFNQLIIIFIISPITLLITFLILTYTMSIIRGVES